MMNLLPFINLFNSFSLVNLDVFHVLKHSSRSYRNANACIICNNLIGEFSLRRRYLKPKTYLFQDKKGILMSYICKCLHSKLMNVVFPEILVFQGNRGKHYLAQI